jgi:hypothetical protein
VKTETDVMNLCRLAAQGIGGVLWRNNNGALPRPDGVPVRFGLANDSSKLNAVFKSSDLIGICPDGRFAAVECKEPGWVWRGTPEEVAQLRYVLDVRARGGRAGFATRPGHAGVILTGDGYGALTPASVSG